jgi:iron complex outermembrane receptor protein
VETNIFSAIPLRTARKGVPLYRGPDTAATFRNFWSWPYWNMDTSYFHSVTKVGDLSSIKFRAFYNRFNNAIDMFSNDTYAVMNTSNAEHSAYNEHTDGASTELTTLSALAKRHQRILLFQG